MSSVESQADYQPNAAKREYYAEACVDSINGFWGDCSNPSDSVDVTVSNSVGGGSGGGSCNGGGGTSPPPPGTTPFAVGYQYGASGALTEAYDVADSSEVFWQAAGANAWGEVTEASLGGAISLARTYDAGTGAMTSITSGPNGTGSVLNLSYGYNTSLSLTSLTDADQGLDETFGYDAWQHLTAVTRTPASGTATSAAFHYGSAGQFTQGPAGSYSYGTLPAHSPSSTSGLGSDSYNADGDRTAGGGVSSVVWNALGEATSITSGGNAIDLTYGPDGALLDTSDSSCGGRYLGPFLKVGGNNRWAVRVIVGGHVVAVFNDDGSTVATEYLVDDHLGSTAAVADAQGNLLERVAYGAWGNFVNPATGTGSISPGSIAGYTTVTYTGHELLANSGLIDMGARLYDPETGLFLSPDPTVAQPYNTQDLNQFAYVLNNPTTLVDPYGYFDRGSFFLGLAEAAWAGVDYVGLAAAEVGTEGGATPVVYAGLVENTDLAYNAWQNISAAFQNQGPQVSPLNSLIGEIPNQAAQAALTYVEGTLDPGEAAGVFGRYALRESTLTGLRVGAGAGGGSNASLGGGAVLGWGSPGFGPLYVSPGGGAQFMTNYQNGDIQFTGVLSSLYEGRNAAGWTVTINAKGGWAVSCTEGGGCSGTGFVGNTEVHVDSGGLREDLGYYPGGGMVVRLPGGNTLVLENGGALGTIVWGTEGQLAAAGE